MQVLDDDSKNFCDQPTSEKELGIALYQMNSTSSPGGGGFTTAFYKYFWKDLKDIIAGSLKQGLEKGELSYEQREGLLILLPKKDKDLLEIENFRPISLLNVDYKILTKCLSNRLQKVLNKLIDFEQNGFIRGRNICNATLSISEIIAFCWNENLSYGILSLDMKKAFDMVDRSYIIRVLKHMNFGETFIEYIKCICKNNFSTIVRNGVRELEFGIERGCRQGDGISALLFIIALQPLMGAIKSDPRIQGIKIKNKTLKLELLADDTSVYIKNEADILAVLDILNEFQKVSGLTINEDKSKILWLGKTPKTSKIGELETVQTLKSLGIDFSADPGGTRETNYQKLIAKVHNLCEKFKRFHYDFSKRLCFKYLYFKSSMVYK